MPATRVRVVFEFRNGDGNFLSKRTSETFVECSSEWDFQALSRACLVAISEHETRAEALIGLIKDARFEPTVGLGDRQD